MAKYFAKYISFTFYETTKFMSKESIAPLIAVELFNYNQQSDENLYITVNSLIMHVLY